MFAEFLKAADKGEKAKGADNLRKGRALLEKQVKGAKPIELSIKIDGKTFNGEFLGVEVMNVPFTGPGLPLATNAHVADGLLDVVCFDAARRRDFEQWLDAPQDAQAPVTARQGKTIELVWADTANRLDDEFLRQSRQEAGRRNCLRKGQAQDPHSREASRAKGRWEMTEAASLSASELYRGAAS